MSTRNEGENNLEDDLRRALRRVDAPRGFTERVMRRAEPRTAPRWAAIAAALAIASIVPLGVHEYQQEREARARVAGQQLAIALKIAGQKLHTAHRMIRRKVDGA